MASEVGQWLGSLALPAPIIETDHTRLPSALISGPAGPGEAMALHHHADEIFETGVFKPEGPVDLGRLGLVLSDPASGILRAKAPDRSGRCAPRRSTGRTPVATFRPGLPG